VVALLIIRFMGIRSSYVRYFRFAVNVYVDCKLGFRRLQRNRVYTSGTTYVLVYEAGSRELKPLMRNLIATCYILAFSFKLGKPYSSEHVPRYG
jgi:hypothetical protein